MWFEFFRFDLRYQLRQPLLWVSGLVFALLAFLFGLSKSGLSKSGSPSSPRSRR